MEQGNAGNRKMVRDLGFCVCSNAVLNRAFNSRLVFFQSSFKGTEAVAEILSAAEGAACFTH